MTADINRVILTGRATRDAELRTTQTGVHVLSFGLAFNDIRRNRQTGEWEDIPNFIDCSLFGECANALSSIVVKGMKLTIEGKLRYSSWEQQDGSKRSKHEVIVDKLILPPNNNQAPQTYQQAQQFQQAPQAYKAPQQAPAQAYQAPAAYQQAQAAPPQQYAQAPQQTAMAYADDDIPF